MSKDQKAIVNSDGTVSLYGFTDNGEKILIPSTLVWDIFRGRQISFTTDDIKSRFEAEEQDITLSLTDDELRDIAEDIIERRDDCDLISEAYWHIVDEIIEEFFKKGQ